jgi:PAS domain S-box-containing protein
MSVNMVEEEKINLTISENLLKNLQGMFYKLTSPPSFTLIYVSQGCISLTGYSVEELLSIDLVNVIHPEDRDKLLSIYKQPVQNLQSNTMEYRIICKDGSVKWVKDVASITYNDQDEILDVEGFITDITKETVENLAVKSLEKQHEGLLTELTHKYNELMQFNYIVSHNLRSPIANIIGLTEIIKFHYENEASETGELVNFIADSAQSIDAIIQDLNLVLSSRKPMNEKFERINLDEIIASVKNNLKKQIKDSNAIFNISVPEELSHIKSIRSYIQSIFYNLISNAIKYKKDEVEPVISISASKCDDTLILELEDNGLGMDLKAIGDKLFGLYKKFNFDKEGRGLGLHMTKTQIESLGGKIEVESEINKGTTFRVSIPVIE